jgi:hypothetical protein
MCMLNNHQFTTNTSSLKYKGEYRERKLAKKAGWKRRGQSKHYWVVRILVVK